MDSDASTTILARLLTAGLSEERARSDIEAGHVLVDGAKVTDPDHPAALPARWLFAPR